MHGLCDLGFLTDLTAKLNALNNELQEKDRHLPHMISADQHLHLPYLSVNHIRRWIISNTRTAFLKNSPQIFEVEQEVYRELIVSHWPHHQSSVEATIEGHQLLIKKPKPLVSSHEPKSIDAVCGLSEKQALLDISSVEMIQGNPLGQTQLYVLGSMEDKEKMVELVSQIIQKAKKRH
ncbi:hypothetical protein DPEC_G00125520 [Dallia pectoralis]|uniref:Uncharacterized protein n=1 Tax=Dallia pectoralis TaxID=75939 RepID=A0ACC2GR94_DALPE|nr:hypothetical protein DPEC_G00125520 [Dallia pectoralis]